MSDRENLDNDHGCACGQGAHDQFDCTGRYAADRQVRRSGGIVAGWRTRLSGGWHPPLRTVARAPYSGLTSLLCKTRTGAPTSIPSISTTTSLSPGYTLSRTRRTLARNRTSSPTLGWRRRIFTVSFGERAMLECSARLERVESRSDVYVIRRHSVAYHMSRGKRFSTQQPTMVALVV